MAGPGLETREEGAFVAPAVSLYADGRAVIASFWSAVMTTLAVLACCRRSEGGTVLLWQCVGDALVAYPIQYMGRSF